MLAHPVDDDVNARLVGKKSAKWFWAPGKIVGAAPTQAGVAIGLYVIGRYVVASDPAAPPSRHFAEDEQVVSHGVRPASSANRVAGLRAATKYACRRDRPDGSCCAFPSGHAASAFAAASVIERHFGYRMSVPAMVIATYVATSRLHDNVHFLSDVIIGVGHRHRDGLDRRRAARTFELCADPSGGSGRLRVPDHSRRSERALN